MDENETNIIEFQALSQSPADPAPVAVEPVVKPKRKYTKRKKRKQSRANAQPEATHVVASVAAPETPAASPPVAGVPRIEPDTTYIATLFRRLIRAEPIPAQLADDGLVVPDYAVSLPRILFPLAGIMALVSGWWLAWNWW